MTDRAKGFVIALDNDIRIDDVEPIINAIKMIKGVNNVEPLIADSSDFVARSRYKSEVTQKIFKHEESKPKRHTWSERLEALKKEKESTNLK